MTLSGIDVSAAGQGPGFDWEAWRGKIQFAAVKVTEGVHYDDPCARRNIAGARSIGCTVIGYHFLHTMSGVAQAEWFLANAHAAGLRPGDLIAVDAEDLGRDGLSADWLAAAASYFDAGIDAHFPGYHPVLYTEISLAPWLTALEASPLWLANPSGEKVTGIGPWKVISFEQTGQRGVDTDVFYGDAAQLAALAVR